MKKRSNEDKIVEIILIINELTTNPLLTDSYGAVDTKRTIDLILNDALWLDLTHFSKRDYISKIIDIVSIEFPNDDSGLIDWYLNTMDSESIKAIMSVDVPYHNPATPLIENNLCFQYPEVYWSPLKEQRESSDNLLTFYLNLYYDHNRRHNENDDNRLFSKFYEYSVVNPDTVALFHSEYYNLTYAALTYAAAVNVSNSPSPKYQALEIEKGVSRAANIFLFHTIIAPYDEVKSEYTQCYDVDALFPPDTYAFANCMASFVKTHFENLKYQNLIDSGLDNSEDITLFFTDTARFYLNLLKDIRLSVAASMQEIKERIDQAFPTPMKVCQAAENAATDLAILNDITHTDYGRARSNVSAVLDSAGVADKDDILNVLGSNTGRTDAVNEIFTYFDSLVSGPPIFSNGHLNCDSPPLPRDIKLFNVIQPISKKAGDIITPAKEDREAAEAVKRFLEGLGGQSQLQQLKIVLDVVDSYIAARGFPLTLTSSTFRVNVRASDYRTLDELKVTIRSSETPAIGQLIEKTYDSADSDDVISWVCEFQGSLENCDVVVEIDASSLVDQSSGSGYSKINIKAVAIDSPSSNSISASLNADVPSHIPPVITDFTLMAMTHNGQGDDYYTGLVFSVSATDEAEPDLKAIKITSPQTKITSGGSSTQPFGETCVLGEEKACVKTFTINVPKKDSEGQIITAVDLTATAYDYAGSSSLPKTITQVIPSESIPGCQHIDLGKNKNRYDLRLIYAWAESPNIEHTITGTLLTNSPDLDP